MDRLKTRLQELKRNGWEILSIESEKIQAKLKENQFVDLHCKVTVFLDCELGYCSQRMSLTFKCNNFVECLQLCNSVFTDGVNSN